MLSKRCSLEDALKQLEMGEKKLVSRAEELNWLAESTFESLKVFKDSWNLLSSFEWFKSILSTFSTLALFLKLFWFNSSFSPISFPGPVSALFWFGNCSIGAPRRYQVDGLKQTSNKILIQVLFWKLGSVSSFSYWKLVLEVIRKRPERLESYSGTF